jgi:hypothetical protein
MIVTVFRHRVNPDTRDEYVALLTRIVEISKTIPGYVSQKRFTAGDGERGDDRRIRDRRGPAGVGDASRAHRGDEARAAEALHRLQDPSLRRAANRGEGGRGVSGERLRAILAVDPKRSLPPSQNA